MTAKGQRKNTFTPAEDEHLTTWRGIKSGDEIGAELGRSGDAIRRRWRVLGLAGKRASDTPPEPPVERTDAELIALHLATKGATIVPAGTAAGLSSYEREFRAAMPDVGGWRQQTARWHDAQKRKRGAI